MSQVVTKQLLDSTMGVPSRYGRVPSDFVSPADILGIPTLNLLERERFQASSRVSHSCYLITFVVQHGTNRLGKQLPSKKSCSLLAAHSARRERIGNSKSSSSSGMRMYQTPQLS